METVPDRQSQGELAIGKAVATKGEAIALAPNVVPAFGFAGGYALVCGPAHSLEGAAEVLASSCCPNGGHLYRKCKNIVH